MAKRKAQIARALSAKLLYRMGFAQVKRDPKESANHRNAVTAKLVLPDQGPVGVNFRGDRDDSYGWALGSEPIPAGNK